MSTQGLLSETVELLMGFGTDIHFRDTIGKTPLHRASCFGFLEIVKDLVDKRADINAKNSCGETPLMLAAQGSHKEIVDLLINCGADIHCRDKIGWNGLHHASKGGSVEIVQWFVNKGFDLDMKSFHGEETPLMVAARNSHKEVVELLIKSGADIHCCEDGVTVLHHASYYGWVEIVRYLINKEVSLNIKSSTLGETAMLMAARQSHKEVVEVLIKSGADIHCSGEDNWTVLHHASYYGWVEIVQYLVNKEVALEIKSSTSGERADMMDVGRSHEEIVELLMISEADICCNADIQRVVNKRFSLDIKTSNGKTPLMLAAERSHREVFELLLYSGADINCVGDLGKTVLHLAAAYEGWVDIVQYLIGKRFPLNIKNSLGETSLMVAASWRRAEVAELLIKYGADVHCSDDEGKTALHYASKNECIEIVQLLLKGGADLNGKDFSGATPLHLAVEMNEIKMADYLLKVGSNCNLEDIKGKSPFNYLIISEEKHVEIIKLCIEKGAYVKSSDYNNLLKDPSLKKAILQDVKLCSQAVINKFNNHDLALLYKGLASTQKLPHIDKMKIGGGSGAALEVEQAVSHEIQVKGYCDPSKIVPMSLKILCVKSFIERLRPAFSQEKSHNAMKRLGIQQEYPCKKNM